ncbi:MAG: PEP-CTERM sorting domain-containing protein [Chthoniobacterales bacterium]
MTNTTPRTPYTGSEVPSLPGLTIYRWKTPQILWLVALGLLCLANECGICAEPVVVAENAGPFNGVASGYSATYWAQVFTAGEGGKLSEISLVLTAANADVVYALTSVSGGLPSAPLAEVTVSQALVPQSAAFQPVDFSSFNIFLEAGGQYAVTVRAVGTTDGVNSVGWAISTEADSYDSGHMLLHGSQGWERPSGAESYDGGFRISVVPEPGTAVLLLLGGLGLLLRSGWRPVAASKSNFPNKDI